MIYRYTQYKYHNIYDNYDCKLLLMRWCGNPLYTSKLNTEIIYHISKNGL